MTDAEKIGLLERDMLDLRVKIAGLEAREKDRDGDLAEVKSDVKLLLAMANRQKGGWAVIAAFSAVAGAIGGLVGMFVRLKGG